jgi:glutamate-1-semialdehyde 2,1-aminomutase
MAKKLNMMARNVFVGGVNSPVRAFKNIGCEPIIIEKARGSKLYDINNKKYIDFCMSWGAEILGHADKDVVKSIKNSLKNGINFGLTGKSEIELAEIIKNAFPSIELLRFVNSGTEAVMSAIRLARAFTKRDKIIKFDGCYHGHSDSLLVSAGSGVAGIVNAISKGIPSDIIKNTISLPFNNILEFKKIIKNEYKRIASVIIEPIPANMGVINPEIEFLYEIRKYTKRYGILLIFDEIITGFRFCFGGVQNIFDIKPDITCLGKIIGGGLPIGAFGGKKEVMDLLAPAGSVYQAGTFSGNPVVMNAGIATLKKLFLHQKMYEKLNNFIQFIAKEVKKLKNIYFSCYGSMFSIFFTDKRVMNFEEAKKCNLIRFKKWYKKLLKDGIFLPPSQFEACFISMSHTEKDIECFIKATIKNLK